MALAQRAIGRRTRAVFILGLIGAALFYGDAIITPAISVLGAFQGMRDVPALQGLVSGKEITVLSFVLLVGLFMVQARGTARLATFFGPIMLVWFVTIAVLGVVHIADAPVILTALSPLHAVIFLVRHGLVGFLVLGSVFLTVTGAEALYADMGHFGRWPIQSAWAVLRLAGPGAELLRPGGLHAEGAALRRPPSPAFSSTRTGSSSWPRRCCARRWWCWPRRPR